MMSPLCRLTTGICAFFLIMALCTRAQAQEPQPRVELRTTKTAVKLGEPLDLTIRFFHIPIEAIAFKLPASFNTFTLLEQGQVPRDKETPADVTYDYHVRLSYFGLNPVTIDDATFDIIDEPTQKRLHTTQLKAAPLTIEPILVDTSGRELKALKSPIKLKLNGRVYILTAIVFIAFSILIFFFIRAVIRRLRQRIRRKQVESEKQIDPFEEAIDALHRLARDRAHTALPSKVFFSETTFILKRYFHRLFHLPFLDWTTHEVTCALRAGPQRDLVEKTRVADIATLLREADLAKFANAEADDQKKQGHLTSIEEMIRAIEEHKKTRERELRQQLQEDKAVAV